MSSNFDWNNVVQNQDGQPTPPPATGEPAGEWEQMLSQVPDRDGNVPGNEQQIAPVISPEVRPVLTPEPAPELAPQVFAEAVQPPLTVPTVFATPEPAPAVVEETFLAPAPAIQFEIQPTPPVELAPPVSQDFHGTVEPAAWHEESPPQPPVPTAGPYEQDLPKPDSNPTKHFQMVVGAVPPNSRDAELDLTAGLQSLNTTQAEKYELFNQEQRASLNEREAAVSTEGVHIDDILRLAVERKCSDIHLTTGLPPMGRLDGEIVPLPYKTLNPMECRRLTFEILSDDNVQKFESTHELDFSHSVRDCGRFRVNVYMQRGAVSTAIRTIPAKIPSYEDLGLPEIIREMSKRTSGLILVTGPTGSGKSTTIATMINDINANRSGHIMTIEDPIEYLHQHNRCMVNQREMHADTFSFHNALRAVLREDPDIILVGELRDLETIEAALTLAETGHLVFGTLHTRNAPATIDRIIDVFPSDQQAQIRVLLGNTLEGVISQQLLPKIGGGRIAAQEIMVGVPAIKNLIREGKTHQMYSVIETGKQWGMHTLDSALAHLYKSGIVTYDELLMRAVDKDNFAKLAKHAA
jgi:twitching motility protein PilT